MALRDEVMLRRTSISEMLEGCFHMHDDADSHKAERSLP